MAGGSERAREGRRASGITKVVAGQLKSTNKKVTQRKVTAALSLLEVRGA
jgi:hypothetical protein